MYIFIINKKERKLPVDYIHIEQNGVVYGQPTGVSQWVLTLQLVYN
jgi:hypothetical protein